MPIHRLIAAAVLLGALAAALILVAPNVTGTASGSATKSSHFGDVASARPTGDYVPGEVVVGYSQPHPAHSVLADVAVAARAGTATASAPSADIDARVIRLPRGESVGQALARLRRTAGLAYAVPNYVAHASGSWIPDDPGRSHRSGGWESLQWNFLPSAGVNAPQAWANLMQEGHPGGRGVVVAILDTGVAYRDWRQYRRSPDFAGTRFVAPYDFIDRNAFPLDREGHGTFVAGVVAEATNNHIGLTGLAYGASIMPVRVLDAGGAGDAATISRGIRYAVAHGARVINLSLEFDPGTTASDIPDIMSAIRYADDHGVVVVAASGNEGLQEIAYPARDRGVISVGATTRDRCLAYYSNGGPSLDVVAPGGGTDALLQGDPDCHPGRPLPSMYQMTLVDPRHPAKFGFPGDIFGTSMAAPEVSATAALVIASGVLGRHPTPDAILARLEQTATQLGPVKPNRDYGYGLINAGAATAPPVAAGTLKR